MRKDQPETHIEEEPLGTAALVGLMIFFHFGTEQGMGKGAVKEITMCVVCMCLSFCISLDCCVFKKNDSG